MPSDDLVPNRGTKVSLHERFGVFFGLLFVHSLMFLCNLPLVHRDLDFYVEPAWNLAKTGQLRAPASQDLDLSYVDGFYYYPPGYFLILAGWIQLFDASVHSLLVYAHLTHFLVLISIWWLLRSRYGFRWLISLLAVVSMFPTFNHGRPDFTALLFGALAWLAISYRQIVPAALMLGFSLLTSPAIGISSAVAVGLAYLIEERRWRGFLLLVFVSSLTFVAICGIVLTWQNAWSLAYVQFSVNSAVRGQELNALPSLANVGGLITCVVPLGLLTLVPLLYVVIDFIRRRIAVGHSVTTATALAGSLLSLFLLSKGPLLKWMHFFLLARPVFHSAFASWGANRLQRGIGLGTLCLFTCFHLYVQKADFLPLIIPSGRPRYDSSVVALDRGKVLAVDSVYFPMLYQPDRTINYEIVREGIKKNYWQRYRDASRRFSSYDRKYDDLSPEVPDHIIVSQLTVGLYGWPDSERYEQIKGSRELKPLQTFGIRFRNEYQDPYEVLVFRRKDVADRPVSAR